VTNMSASELSHNSARLRGEVASTGGEHPTVIIYWGDNDGGTEAGAWDQQANLGTLSKGMFQWDIDSLLADTTYYLRCYAENSEGATWADWTDSFKTLPVETAVWLVEDFDSMGAYGSAAPAAWNIGSYSPSQNNNPVPSGGGVANAGLTADDGSRSGGSVSYNYGNLSSRDRALGNIPDDVDGDRLISLALQNLSGRPINSFTLRYAGEQWRDSDGTAAPKPEELVLWFVGSSGLTQMGPAFNFAAPQDNGLNDALDGNAPDNRTIVMGQFTPSAPIDVSSTIYLAWHDMNDAATLDHGLAIDDVLIMFDNPIGDEGFEAGFSLGDGIGAHDDWYSGLGPIVNNGLGTAGTAGLSNGISIFTWTAQPFNWWSLPTEGQSTVVVGMDFQANSAGVFGDDLVGWKISDETTNSNHILGVRMVPDGAGTKIEGYWNNLLAGPMPVLATLPAQTPNSWRRLRVGFTKLTYTSCRIDVSL
jgi:hypothetical protein